MKESEQFISLPAGWTRVPLGEVADVKLGKMLSPKAYAQGLEQLPYLRNENVRWFDIDTSDVKLMGFTPEERQKFALKVGDLLVCEGGEPGRCAVVTEATAHLMYQKALHRVRPESRVLSPRYLQYFFRRFITSTALIERRSETTIQHLPREKMVRISIVLPPLPEQRRIVEKIEELFSDLDAGVAALTRVRANLRRYRASVLNAAVTGRLTEAWRRDHPPTEPADRLLARILTDRRRKWEDDQLRKFTATGKPPPKGWREKYDGKHGLNSTPPNWLPPQWAWSMLGQCFEVCVGATPSRSREDYWGGDIPWVSSGEVQFCRVSGTREHITAAGLKNSCTKLNPSGSVLLGMIGEGKTRGQAAILDIAATNNQNCAAVWVSETPIYSEWVYYWLCSQYETTRRGSSGNNQPALNKARVQAMQFPLPPADEQSQIVAEVERRLSVVDAVEAEVEQGLRRAGRLRQAILKRAFQGRLVPQDPTDEPAAALLERLRAREAASGPASARGSAQTKPKARRPKTAAVKKGAGRG